MKLKDFIRANKSLFNNPKQALKFILNNLDNLSIGRHNSQILALLLAIKLRRPIIVQLIINTGELEYSIESQTLCILPGSSTHVASDILIDAYNLEKYQEDIEDLIEFLGYKEENDD